MALPHFKQLVNDALNVLIPTFGEVVTYVPQNGKGEYTLRAVFDRSYEMIDPDTEVVVASNTPRIGVNLNSMFEPPTQGDTVKILDETFRVDDSQEDGQGGAYIYLSRLDDES